MITDTTVTVDRFNDYFVNVGQNLANKIASESGSHLDYMNIYNNNSMFVLPVTPSEICDETATFKFNKNAGCDSFSPNVIKSIIKDIALTLCDIFNKPLLTGCFPDKLKVAKVIPFYKGDNKRLLNNYRSISFLPAFSKILERLMNKRLLDVLNKNEILVKNQFGFREKHSTYMAILDLVDKICHKIDSKNYSMGIFIDLSKAFDTINHKILIDKLEYYGIRGVELQWFISYLSKRSQHVQIGDICSNYLHLTCGVPQGSILGTYFFMCILMIW